MAFQNGSSLEILLYFLFLSSVRFLCSRYEAILKQDCKYTSDSEKDLWIVLTCKLEGLFRHAASTHLLCFLHFTKYYFGTV